MIPRWRVRECCRQSQAEVVSNSRNKIHLTWGPPFWLALQRLSQQNDSPTRTLVLPIEYQFIRQFFSKYMCTLLWFFFVFPAQHTCRVQTNVSYLVMEFWKPLNGSCAILTEGCGSSQVTIPGLQTTGSLDYWQGSLTVHPMVGVLSVPAVRFAIECYGDLESKLCLLKL